jgi:hypothetical protein
VDLAHQGGMLLKALIKVDRGAHVLEHALQLGRELPQNLEKSAPWNMHSLDRL